MPPKRMHNKNLLWQVWEPSDLFRLVAVLLLYATECPRNGHRCRELRVRALQLVAQVRHRRGEFRVLRGGALVVARQQVVLRLEPVLQQTV